MRQLVYQQLYDAGMILRSHWRRVSLLYFHCTRIYDPKGDWVGRSFLNVLVLSSFGNCSPYITRLLCEGSEYLRIRNHNLFTSSLVCFGICDVLTAQFRQETQDACGDREVRGWVSKAVLEVSRLLEQHR